MATVSSKGQITIPQLVRQALGLSEHDRVIFAITAEGEVTLRPLKFPTLESLAGAAGTLAKSPPADPVAAAYEERLGRKYRRS